LPINLRSFLAEQLGCRGEPDDETILSLAAHADEITLNKLARAIRRYSTERAREAWTQCSVAVARFADAARRKLTVVLCLRCVCVNFGEAAAGEHEGSRCVPISLTRVEGILDDSAAAVAEQIQRRVEEFRALRAAFGLPHFNLDCYIRGEQLTLMWRPLP